MAHLVGMPRLDSGCKRDTSRYLQRGEKLLYALEESHNLQQVRVVDDTL